MRKTALSILLQSFGGGGGWNFIELNWFSLSSVNIPFLSLPEERPERKRALHNGEEKNKERQEKDTKTEVLHSWR